MVPSEIREADNWDRNEWEISIRANWEEALKRAPEGVLADEALMKLAVAESWRALTYASGDLLDNEEMLMTAAQQSWWAVEFVSQNSPVNHRDATLQAVKQCWRALGSASDELRSEKDLVLEAIHQHGNALQFATSELRSNREVVFDAVLRHGSALYFASESLLADEELVLKAVVSDPSTIKLGFEAFINITFNIRDLDYRLLLENKRVLQDLSNAVATAIAEETGTNADDLSINLADLSQSLGSCSDLRGETPDRSNVVLDDEGDADSNACGDADADDGGNVDGDDNGHCSGDGNDADDRHCGGDGGDCIKDGEGEGFTPHADSQEEVCSESFFSEDSEHDAPASAEMEIAPVPEAGGESAVFPGTADAGSAISEPHDDSAELHQGSNSSSPAKHSAEDDEGDASDLETNVQRCCEIGVESVIVSSKIDRRIADVYAGMEADVLEFKLSEGFEGVRGLGVAWAGDGQYEVESLCIDNIVLTMTHTEMRTSKDFVMRAVRLNGFAIQYVTGELRRDKALAVEACKQNGEVLGCLSDDFRGTFSIASAAVRQSGQALRHASEDLREDTDLVMEAVQQDGRALQHALGYARQDPPITAAAAKQTWKAVRFTVQTLNLETMLAVVEQDWHSAEDLWNLDRSPSQEQWIALTAHNPSIIQFHQLRANRDVVISAVRTDGLSLRYASPSLRADKTVVREAMHAHPDALWVAHPLVRKDPDLKLLYKSGPMRSLLLRFSPAAGDPAGQSECGEDESSEGEGSECENGDASAGFTFPGAVDGGSEDEN